MPVFEETWKGKAKQHLPGWNPGLDLPGNGKFSLLLFLYLTRFETELSSIVHLHLSIYPAITVECFFLDG